MTDTETFLRRLFGDLPEDLWFYLWTLQDKRSHWFQSVDEALAVVEPWTRPETGLDCYVGVALARESRGPHERIKSSQTVGIVGLWADIDVSGPEHKKHCLPPTIEDASQLVAAVEIVPTFLVHSGHGLQAWWLFKEPWLFETDTDRQRAQERTEGFCRLFKRKAKASGWNVDSVHDLARVMRLPGTWNHKGTPVQSRILAGK